jgi:hypothetical protein
MKSWILSIGLYPGILIGVRSYPDKESTLHVLYIPLIEIVLEVFND